MGLLVGVITSLVYWPRNSTMRSVGVLGESGPPRPRCGGYPEIRGIRSAVVVFGDPGGIGMLACPAEWACDQA